MRSALLIAALAVASACSRGPGPPRAEAPGAEAPTGVPVQVATAEVRDLQVSVNGSGQTAAMAQQKVRAPFRGLLVELKVTDGDRVTAGQVIGNVVSQDSLAAVTGAEQMLATASTEAEKADAVRALLLARQGLVRTPIHAPADGVVVAHAATAGSLVTSDEDLLTIAAATSIVFQADIVQSDLPRVRPGQKALVDLPAYGKKLPATVHGMLPAASARNLTAQVRIDFATQAPVSTGLFGTVAIAVADHPGALVVPAAAVLRNDVSGEESVATVSPGATLHWVKVRTGLSQGASIEVEGQGIGPGTVVVTSGQVGLPEGAALQVQR